MASTLSLDPTAFAGCVRQHFDTRGMDDARLDALREACAHRLGDGATRERLARLLDPELAHIVFGQSWWEARAREIRVGDRASAADDLDLACMLLATEAALPDRPAPLPYRPRWLHGSWRCVGVSADGHRYTSPAGAAARVWTLRADGAAIDGSGGDGAGDADAGGAGGPRRIEPGWTWRAHEQGGPCLWLDAPGGARAAQLPLRREPDGALVMTDSAPHPRRSRWLRVS